MQQKEFLNLVLDELIYLKDNVSEKLLDRLDFATFEPDLHSKCIYGQMTGHSESVLANQLYPKRFELISREVTSEDFIPFEKQIFTEGTNFTALEKYLYMVDSEKHLEIIQFLKSEISTIRVTL